MNQLPTVVIMGDARMMAYSVSLSFHLKSIAAAVLFHQLEFWSNKSARGDDWFYKSNRELQSETGLTSDQLRLAVKKLIAAEFIETRVMRAEGHATTHFHILKTMNTTIQKRNKVASLDWVKPQTNRLGKTPNYTSGKPQTITEDNHKITHNSARTVVDDENKKKDNLKRLNAMKQTYGFSK